MTLPATGTVGATEFWAMSDSLASTCPLVMKIQYGRTAGSAPYLAFTFGATTNGAGTLFGNVTPTYSNPQLSGSSPSGTGSALYECDFSWASGRFAMLLWRDLGGAATIFLGIERSLNSSGSYTGSYVTVLGVGMNNNSNSSGPFQLTVPALGTGGPVAIGIVATGYNTNNCAWATINWYGPTVYAGSAAVSPVFPMIGYFDNPVTVAVTMKASDQAEGANFSATLYGTAHNYLFTKSGNFNYLMPSGANGGVSGMGMRWE